MKKFNPNDLPKVIAVFLIIICIVYIGLLSYKPEDLTNKEPIRSFTYNQCEKYPEHAELFRGNPTILYTNPQQTGQTGRLESCLGWTVYVYEEEIYEGEKWLLIKVNDLQGWQKESIME